MTYTEEQYNEVLRTTAASLKEKDAECAAAMQSCADERDKLKARNEELLAFVAKADEALKGGASIEDVRSILDPLIEDQLSPEIQRELAELTKMEEEIQAEADKRIAEIEAKKLAIQGK